MVIPVTLSLLTYKSKIYQHLQTPHSNIEKDFTQKTTSSSLYRRFIMRYYYTQYILDIPANYICGLSSMTLPTSNAEFPEQVTHLNVLSAEIYNYLEQLGRQFHS